MGHFTVEDGESYLALRTAYSHRLTSRMRFEPEFMYLTRRDTRLRGQMFMVFPNLSGDLRNPQQTFVPTGSIGFGATYYRYRRQTLSDTQ